MILPKKYLSFYTLLVSFFCVFSQDFSDNWKSHFAYVNFTDIQISEGRIYVAAANTLFVHDTATNTNQEFTTVNGLSGEDITKIYYSDREKIIIVGYANGLVEIIDELSGNVISLVDIQNKTAVPLDSLKINNFAIDENLLYIATGFGIVVYDLDKNVFKDTYFISNASSIVSDVLSVEVFEDSIFASIKGRGTFTGSKTNVNLIEFASWIKLQDDVFNTIKIFSGKAIAHDKNKIIYALEGGTFKSTYTDTENIVNLSINDNILTVTFANKVVRLNAQLVEESSIDFTDVETINNIENAVFVNGEVYYSDENNGFFKTVSQNFQNSVAISPSGPMSNDIFAMDLYDNDLWLVYGAVDAFFAPISKKLGASRFRGNEWTNIPWETFNVDGALNAISVLSDVVINKQNKEQVFVGSFRRGGLYEINNAQEVTLFNNTNSNVINSPVSPDFISAYTFDFDSNNDLWFFNGELREGSIKRFRSDTEALGQENSINIPESLIPDSNQISRFNINEMLFDEADNLYMTSPSSGILAFQKRTNRVTSLIPERLELGFANVKALAIDFNDNLWVGATEGIRIVENPERIFDQGNNAKGEAIIIEDEEAGGIAQELFFRQSISDIKVDASNNKWVATSGGGVFYLSPDGTETIMNFTKDNSPLPSNLVNDIMINNDNGSVFFATSKGLVEFTGGTTNSQEDFEKFKIFPNPVRPEHKDVKVKIQGLTAGANVKITDIEGNLVFEVQNQTFGGKGSGEVEWDTTAFSGSKVASGVYLVLVTGKEGEQSTIGKLLIVR